MRSAEPLLLLDLPASFHPPAIDELRLMLGHANPPSQAGSKGREPSKEFTTEHFKTSKRDVCNLIDFYSGRRICGGKKMDMKWGLRLLGGNVHGTIQWVN